MLKNMIFFSKYLLKRNYFDKGKRGDIMQISHSYNCCRLLRVKFLLLQMRVFHVNLNASITLSKYCNLFLYLSLKHLHLFDCGQISHTVNNMQNRKKIIHIFMMDYILPFGNKGYRTTAYSYILGFYLTMDFLPEPKLHKSIRK